jgi:hypothetical protein
MNKHLKSLKGKSYNEVMNEWAAQRSFLRRASTGLIRPGHDSMGLARVWGWIWRYLILAGIPLLMYLFVLRTYGRSDGFINQLISGTKRFLGAEQVTMGRTRWDLNGGLRIETMKIRGSSTNCFHEVKLENVSTSIPLSQVFKSDWHLTTVDATHANVSLRPGISPKTAASFSEPGIPLLTAGWGVKPDFSQLVVDRYKADNLNLTWGGTPATSGDITGGMGVLLRNAKGWDFVVVGGVFRQCWFDQIRLAGAKLQIDNERAVIEKSEFAVAGGGRGSCTGSITLGEAPEVDATINLENTPFHPFLPEFFRPYVKAVCKGTVKLTGSTNRSTGILMDSNFTLQSGTISGVPVFRALELATEETHVAQPEITGGHIHFTSQGTQDTGGFLVEANDVAIDCGTTLKISLTIRHERKQTLATNAREAVAAAEAADAAKAAGVKTGDNISLTTTGTLRIGLPPETVAKLKPSIRQEFFTREDQGLHWMEVPYRMEDGEFTKDTADRIIALQNGGK